MTHNNILIILGSISLGFAVACSDQKKDKNKKLEEELKKAQELLDLSTNANEASTKVIDEQKAEITNYKEHLEDSKKEQKKNLSELAQAKEKIHIYANLEELYVTKSKELDAKNAELKVLESRLTRDTPDNPMLTDEIRSLKEKIKMDEIEIAQINNDKQKMSQELKAQQTKINQLGQYASVINKTLEFKAGIYLSQTKINSQTSGACYHIAEIKADGNTILAISCADGQVEIMKSHVERLDIQTLKSSIAYVGMLLEITKDEGCPESNLDRFKGVVIDKGTFSFSALDVENIILQTSDSDQITLSSVAMSGFVTPNPSLELARRISADSPQSPYKRAVVHYLEKSAEPAKTGCFDKNLNFKPN